MSALATDALRRAISAVELARGFVDEHQAARLRVIADELLSIEREAHGSAPRSAEGRSSWG